MQQIRRSPGRLAVRGKGTGQRIGRIVRGPNVIFHLCAPARGRNGEIVFVPRRAIRIGHFLPNAGIVLKNCVIKKSRSMIRIIGNTVIIRNKSYGYLWIYAGSWLQRCVGNQWRISVLIQSQTYGTVSIYPAMPHIFIPAVCIKGVAVNFIRRFLQNILHIIGGQGIIGRKHQRGHAGYLRTSCRSAAEMVKIIAVIVTGAPLNIR